MSDPFAVGANAPDDDLFQADLSGADGAELEGEFLLRLIGIDMAESRAGNPMWDIDYDVVSKIDGDVALAGESVKLFLAQTNNAAWKTKEWAIAHGLQVDEEGNVSFRRSEVVGTQIVAEIVMQEYEGRKRPGIEAMRAHPQGAGYRGEAPTGEIPF